MNLSKRITIFVLAAIVICSVTVGIFAYFLERNEVSKANAQRALAICRTVGAALDEEEYIEIMNTQETNEYYDDFKKILDDSFFKNDVLYLYVIQYNGGGTVTYFAEGYSEIYSEEPAYELGDTESTDVYPSELFVTLADGVETMTDTYNLGGLGDMVSAFVPIMNSTGHIIGAIGVDLSIDDTVAAANRFGLLIIIIVGVLCVIAVFLVMWFVKTFIGAPIREMTDAAGKLALGNTDITVIKRRNDEIGQLAESFINMVVQTKEQATLIERLSDGDLTVNIKPRSSDDTIGNSLVKLCDNLNSIMRNIQDSINQVTTGSRQIADGSQIVAQGSAEQSASIEQLASNIEQLTESTRQNADSAKQAAVLSDSVMKNAETGNAQMEQMLLAVQDINNASSQIEKVIKVIDDIAFQTNILALNAAVEAARAGQHGKGFAVVADEVRNLAAKSAAAAKDTGGLITNSMEKAALGAKIAEETSASLRGIVDGIAQSTKIVSEIARTGGEQETAVGEIQKGLSQVSHIVQQNSSSAQESASASEEMSGQAQMLSELVLQFSVKDDALKLPPQNFSRLNY